MPATIDIPSEYLEEIRESSDPVAELVTFLQDHVSMNLLDYEDTLEFNGYIDGNGDPQIIVVETKLEGPVFTVVANLEYSLKEQQNSCADSLADIKHSHRVIYTFRNGGDMVEYEQDPNYVDPDYHQEEYGY